MKKRWFIFLPLLAACEKEISVDLPPVEPKLVVEAFIEQGNPPIVVLTESRGFFEPADSNSLKEIVVPDADVFVHDGTQEYKLNYIPFGFYGGYTNLLLSGQVGKTYDLRIEYEGKTYTSSTLIPTPVPLDSLWFQVELEGDSLGFVWAACQEPAGQGNAYRWFAKRIGKDNYFLPPFGSSFDDEFIDGKKFDFGFSRGIEPGSQAEDDNNRERGYFKLGDTVAVRFCAIDHEVYEFFFTYEMEAANSGNPFAAPTTVRTNIKGGALGYWGGFGAVYDTLICR